MARERQSATKRWAWARFCGSPLSPQAIDVGLLLLRMTMGAAFVIHGWPKIQHPLAWSNHVLAAPPVMQLIAAIAEFAGGIALVLGLGTRLFAFLLFCDMLTAIALVKIPNGARFVASHGGNAYELEAMYSIGALLLFLAGPGRFAFDARFITPNRTSEGRRP